MNETVGFIGLGTMGMPMVSNLAKGGVQLVVHDVSAAARAAAGKLAGVPVASSAGAAAAQVDVLFTCLPNDDIVRAAYLGSEGIGSAGRGGVTPRDCSTVRPRGRPA